MIPTVRHVLASLCVIAALASAAEPVPGSKRAEKLRAQNDPAAAWWRQFDSGPFQADTFLTGPNGDVAALKGLAIKLGAKRDVSVVFDTELLAWRAGFDGTVVLAGTPWDGAHGGNSHYPAGKSLFFFQNPKGLGFGVNGHWADPREPKAGSLPHALARYRGLFRHGNQVIVHYTIGGTDVLELPELETVGDVRTITRTVNLGATAGAKLELLVCDRGAELKADAQVYIVGAPAGVTFDKTPEGRGTLTIPAGTPATRFKIVYAERTLDPAQVAAARDLAALTKGGPSLFPQTFAVKGQLDPNAATKSYAVDVIPLPSENPWRSPARFGGFDFFPDGKRVACSSWNGDVWIAEGIDGELSKVTWRRFAAGMFQTLGLKIVDGVIYTQGRDQITRLVDLDGDGEADSYECFNNDIMITAGFHEFSFDLQTDRAGNFYFSKAMPVNQGGRGFMAATPHNGTVLKVSKDGEHIERMAWGFRAPGGVGVSPDGVVTTGENEGSWVPACKITWTVPGKLTFNGVVPSKWENRNQFAGVLPGSPTDYERPLCWIPYNIDNSSGSQVWVPENTTWDPRHAGEMLHLSYGKSSIFRVLREEVNGHVQGGVYKLPIDITASAMRARFHPQNGQLYVVGFRGWQTNGRDAFQRVRYTGITTPEPVELHAHKNGLLIRFSAPLDAKSAEDPSRYSVSKWNYVWGPQYGSGRFSIDQRDLAAEERAITVPSKGEHNSIDTVQVGAAKVLDDGRSVFLYLPKMTTAMQMEVKMDLVDTKGKPVRETIYNTVNVCGGEFTVPGVDWDKIRVADVAVAGEPGLAMSFNAEITDTVRVDQLALTVPAGMSPSVFIAPKDFGVAFQGTLVIPERDDYTFSLEGNGTVTLQIDGKVVAQGALPVTAKASVTLAKGPHAIFCSYASAEEGDSRVRLMWSSPQFRTEPVPASAFRFLPGTEIEAWNKARLGREVLAAAHCMKCHVPRNGLPRDAAPELLATAPDFVDAGNRFEAGWLEAWVRSPQGRCPTVAPEHATDIAAYLATLKNGDAGAGVVAIPSDAKSINAGAIVVEKLHLAYWIDPMFASRKHTDAGLVEFLLRPAQHHPDTVFPDVRLTREEALLVAAYIRSKQPRAAAVSRGDASAGKVALAKSCAACHDPKNATRIAPAFEEIARADWTVKGCVASPDNRGRAPNLRLAPEQATALIAFRNADRDVGMASLKRFAPAEYASEQIKALNCAQCHAAPGGENKLPDITFAGEKFDPEWMAKLFEGRHGKLRGWQEARMPAFASRSRNLALGLAAKHGMPLKSEPPVANPELAAIGAKIAGTEGYSCVACHDAGSRKALQVFEGQGPNLQLAGERLRYDYFQRWMHFPQRVAPATIMPRYTKDRDHALLDTHFAGDAEKQFQAVWQWVRTLNAAPGP